MNNQLSMEENIGLNSSLFFITEQYKILDRLQDFDLMNEYLNEAIKMGSIEAIFYKGNYYDECKDFTKMIEYYEKGAEKNDINSVFNLGHYYKEIKDYENMKKWFLKGCELSDPDCMCEMGKYYEILGEEETKLNEENKFNDEYYNKNIYIKKYYSMAIELNYLRAFHLLGQWYLKIGEPDDMANLYIKGIEEYKYNRHLKNQSHKNLIISESYNEELVVKMMERTGQYFDDEINDFKKAIKYYKMAIEKNSIQSMYNLGRIYYEQGIYDKMIKYFLMGINHHDIDCMYELAIYYQDINDFENMKKYYIMALEEKVPSNPSKNTVVNDGEKDFNLFIIKEFLETIENPSINIINKLNKIKCKKEIMIYENKKKLFTKLNNIMECGICYDEKLNIDLLCGHCICVDCYPKIYQKACPFCRL